MRNFSKHDDQWLVERCNYLTVHSHLLSKYNRDEWDVVHENGVDYIETKPDTDARTFVEQMAQATQDYPPLDEHAYHDAEYFEMLKAVARKAASSGTIMVSTEALLSQLLNDEVQINETSPMHYEVMMSDEDFQKEYGDD